MLTYEFHSDKFDAQEDYWNDGLVLCGGGLHQFWTFPVNTETIYLQLSKRKLQDSYRLECRSSLGCYLDERVVWLEEEVGMELTSLCRRGYKYVRLCY